MGKRLPHNVCGAVVVVAIVVVVVVVVVVLVVVDVVVGLDVELLLSLSTIVVKVVGGKVVAMREEREAGREVERRAGKVAGPAGFS